MDTPIKTLIQSLAILIVLIVICSIIPYEWELREYKAAAIESYGNWAVPGGSGQPVPGGSGDIGEGLMPGEGEPGIPSQISLTESSGKKVEQTTLIPTKNVEQTTEYSPITFEVVEAKSTNLESVNKILYAIISGLGFTLFFLSLWGLYELRRGHYES